MTKISSTVVPTPLKKKRTLLPKSRANQAKQQMLSISLSSKQSSPSSYITSLPENISADLSVNLVTQLFYTTDTSKSPSWDLSSPRLQREKMAFNKISLWLQEPQIWSPANSNQDNQWYLVISLPITPINLLADLFKQIYRSGHPVLLPLHQYS